MSKRLGPADVAYCRWSPTLSATETAAGRPIKDLVLSLRTDTNGDANYFLGRQ